MPPPTITTVMAHSPMVGHCRALLYPSTMPQLAPRSQSVRTIPPDPFGTRPGLCARRPAPDIVRRRVIAQDERKKSPWRRPWPKENARYRRRRPRPSTSGTAPRPASCACSAATTAATIYFPPRPFCPSAARAPCQVIKASGKGKLYCYVIHHRPTPGFDCAVRHRRRRARRRPAHDDQHRRLPADARSAGARHAARGRRSRSRTTTSRCRCSSRPASNRGDPDETEIRRHRRRRRDDRARRHPRPVADPAARRCRPERHERLRARARRTSTASPPPASRPSTLAHYLGITPTWVDGTAVGGCSFMLHVRHAAAAINEGLCKTVLITHGESGKSRVGAGAAAALSRPASPASSRRPSASSARRPCSRSPCCAT